MKASNKIIKEKKNKHLTYKDRTTIAKEVKNHRFIKPCGKDKVISCISLSKAPYVCNGCCHLGSCRKAKYLYDAAVADHEYRNTLTIQRSHLKVTKSQVAAVNEVIAPLMVHKHHSVNHVYASHPELLPFSKSTFYKYVDLGLFNINNIDLPRKVRFKVKKEYDNSRKKIDTRFRLGRQYHDYQDYLEWAPESSPTLRTLWVISSFPGSLRLS